MPRNNPISSDDLRSVNAFRSALSELQRRKPHRLAGPWDVRQEGGHTGACVRHLECIDLEDAPGKDVLSVVGGAEPLLLYGRGDEVRWEARTGGGEPAEAWFQQDAESGDLVWHDGARWKRRGWVDGEWPLLGNLHEETVARFSAAAQAMLEVTDADGAASDAPSERRWPARLVPFVPARRFRRPADRDCDDAIDALAPLDLAEVERRIAAFRAKLGHADVEDFDEDHADDRLEVNSDSDSDVDVSQEGINESWMWTLAGQDWGPSEARNCLFVESALALPPTPICVECEEEGKSFSKSQLSRHPDERRCSDCVGKAVMNSIYRPPTGPSEAPSRQNLLLAPASLATETVHTTSVALCSICRLRLTKQNCTPSQRSKAPSRRRCNNCVGAPQTT